MNIETMFDFLVTKYGLAYQHQTFSNCYGGHWEVETYSYYNESGCFTIYFEVQRGMDFWYASQFSSDYRKLCEREIDISLIEPEIWARRERVWFIKWPFFWWNSNKVLFTLAEVLKAHLAKHKCFFGIQI